MNKILAITMVAALALMGTGAAFAETTLDNAKQIALDKAGLTEEEVVFTQGHKDIENGREVWEVEFRNGLKEYEFDIDANNGQIVTMDVGLAD